MILFALIKTSCFHFPTRDSQATDGVLYGAITQVKLEEQAISVTTFGEPNQKYAII